MAESNTILREDLYEAVWERPVRTIARELGVSDVALAKTCRKLKIPLPGVGYWAKHAANQVAAIPTLPRLRYGETQVAYFPGRLGGPPVPKTVLSPTMSGLPFVPVALELEFPHRLIRNSIPYLEGEGKGNFCGCHTPCIAVRVSPKMLDRSYRIMDAVFKSLEARGYAPEVISPVLGRSYYSGGIEIERSSRTGGRRQLGMCVSDNYLCAFKGARRSRRLF
jgi:hypothetical protein